MASTTPCGNGPFPGRYPTTRLRRNRRSPWSRALVAENRLAAADLIWPLFVREGSGAEAVESMPGVERLGIDRLPAAAREARDLGIPAIALFPCTPQALKTADGREAANPENLVCRAIAALRAAVAGIGIMVDVALDPFTDHGHDGVVVDGEVANDASVEALVRQALVQARAGCDIIAPSDMMDGRIGAIRRALDEAGFVSCPDHGLCCQICLRFLRAVPRCPGFGVEPGCRATSAATRWIPPMATRRCASSPSIWKKAPTW